MNAMILAAGLGTRLRPWTLRHPKALVPVRGVPMLKRVIDSLAGQGFDRIVVNVHHFSSQVVDYVRSVDFGVEVSVSDESGCLLDTGGGIVKACSTDWMQGESVLVHNVDILSNADLGELMRVHETRGDDSTLLVSRRDSRRRLVFDGNMNLRGWHDVADDRYRPDGFMPEEGMTEYPFSGIHVVGPRLVAEMRELMGEGPFPVMDYYLSPLRKSIVRAHVQTSLRLIDIGKPATLSQANGLEGLPGTGPRCHS